MEAAALLVLMGVLSGKLVDFTKFLTNRDWNGALTQLYAWIVGVVVIFLVANADGAQDLILPGTNQALGTLSWTTLLLLGLAGTSAFSYAYDLKKAVDNRDTAATPTLLPGANPNGSTL